MPATQTTIRKPRALRRLFARRLLAVALLLTFISPVALPLFATTADPEASLPACCRRHGKHHCAMTMAMLAIASRPAFYAPPCPFYPTAATPARIVPAHLAAVPRLSVELRCAAAAATPTLRNAKLFLPPTQFTRGPPARLA